MDQTRRSPGPSGAFWASSTRTAMAPRTGGGVRLTNWWLVSGASPCCGGARLLWSVGGGCETVRTYDDLVDEDPSMTAPGRSGCVRRLTRADESIRRKEPIAAEQSRTMRERMLEKRQKRARRWRCRTNGRGCLGCLGMDVDAWDGDDCMLRVGGHVKPPTKLKTCAWKLGCLG